MAIGTSALIWCLEFSPGTGDGGEGDGLPSHPQIWIMGRKGIKDQPGQVSGR